MPYHAAVDPDARLGFARFTGIVTGDDLLGATCAVYEHPAWQAEFDAIWDGGRLDKLRLVPGDVERLVAFKAGWCKEGCGRDVVVSAGLGGKITGELYAYLARGTFEEAHAVASLADALRALGRDALPTSLGDALPETGTS